MCLLFQSHYYTNPYMPLKMTVITENVPIQYASSIGHKLVYIEFTVFYVVCVRGTML